MTRSRRGRRAPIARGVLLLAAILLLPFAATLQTPRETAAQSAGQDSLWAGSNSGIGACADPSSSAALASCFATPAGLQGITIHAAATDGVNVYFAGMAGGLSCPVADLGANCTHIMAGPWGPGKGNEVWSLAAANGQIWIGQGNGELYRCPANVPYADQPWAPSQCVLLDDAGKRSVDSLLLANGTLYAGLDFYGTEQKKQGLLWSCDPQTANDCFTLDSYGQTTAWTLAAGGGYLWAGLSNGILWRCDLNAANACANWDTPGGSWQNPGDSVNAVQSISYALDGTVYAAVDLSPIVSCPTATDNSCSNVLSNVEGWSVAAGAGGVFSSSGTDGLHFGTSPFTAANATTWQSSKLLYLPADGPVGVGGVSLTVKAKALSQKLEKRCSKPSRTARATVTVTGPEGFTKTMKAGACALVKNGVMQHRVDLLDPGNYTVSVQAGKHSREASFSIVQNRTKPVNVKLIRGSAGG